MRKKIVIGISLIEMLIVLTIIGIFATVILPSFSSLVHSSYLPVTTKAFVSSVQFARIEAIRRNKKVIMCASQNGECNDNKSWENGWTVYVDVNANNHIESEEIIRVYPRLRQGYSLRPNVKLDALTFLPNANVRKGNGGLPLMTFRLCAPGANKNIMSFSREIVMSASGRLRVQRGRPKVTQCATK